MRYLIPAFNGEGDTDWRFFPTLIGRIIQNRFDIELGDWIRLHPTRPSGLPGGSVWSARSVDAVGQELVSRADRYDVIFVHRDGAGDPKQVRRDHIDPLIEKCPSANHCIVPIIPVRETEAWLLADLAALAEVTRSPQKHVEDKLDEYNIPEKIPDPKKILDEIIMEFCGPKIGAGDVMTELAEKISLPKLEALPAYKAFLADLDTGLKSIGYPIP